MGVLRKLREWRENKDGELKGPALNTDDATIDGRTANAFVEGVTNSGKKLQHGSVTQNGPSASSDATWDTFQDVSTGVTFAEAFSTSPSLAHMKQQNNGAELVANIKNVSTTGFDLFKVNFSTTDFATNQNDTYWIAVGDA